MTINTNISALQVTNALSRNQASLQSSMQKLSTGSRINTAADDPAGLAISQGLQAQIGGLNQASQNAANGTALIQTASGALTQVSDILQNLRNLAVQAGNDTENGNSRADLQKVSDALTAELTRISTSTTFNGISLLDATAGAGGDGQLTLQVGSNATDTITLDLSGAKVDATSLGVDALDLTTATGSEDAITSIDTAIQSVSTMQADLGAQQTRLQSTQQSLAVDAQNLTAANSQISDTDMASEMANFTKQNVLVQAGTAMLSQANQQSQLVLKLLQG